MYMYKAYIRCIGKQQEIKKWETKINKLTKVNKLTKGRK